MGFRITSNVRVKRGKDGIVRQLQHPRQPYGASARTTAAAAAGEVGHRELADQYLRDVMDAYGLEADVASDLDGAISSSARPEGQLIRFQREKAVRDGATVSYAQTYMGLPVWGAGVTVRLRGKPGRVTGSQSSFHHDVDVDEPPADAPYMPEKIGADVLARLVGIAGQADRISINNTELLIYRYDAGHRGACGHTRDVHDDSNAHCDSPMLAAPPVPESILDGRHYVVGEVQFTLQDEGAAINWSAFIEPVSGAVLLLRAFVGCVDGFVYQRDPITTTGNTAIQADSSAETLNAVRDRVTLPGLDDAGSGGVQHLGGEFVRLENISAPHTPAPTESENFFYPVPTNNFSAVNAYYHCDRLFRILKGMGFDVPAYFDGTTFPVRVDHRATIGGRTNTVNAQAPGNFAGNGSDGFRFALVQVDTGVGMAVEWRVVLHEFGHTILWDNVNSPNFRFSHSAGDSLAAILNDADSLAPDPGRTFPWTVIQRRHDRPVSSWAWGGPNDSAFPVGDPRSEDRAGYLREQILSSTLFRLYQAIGGAHADVVIRQFAARHVTYLIFDAVASLTPFAQPDNAEEFADVVMDSDLGTTEFEAQPGGVVHKVIRWAFEQQGSYQPDGAPATVRTPGAPPAVDVFIDDGRSGEYTPTGALVMDTGDVWLRSTADSGTGHQQPKNGEKSFVYLRVGNRGSDVARDVSVRLFSTENTIAPVWPGDWTPVGTTTVGNVAGQSESVVGPLEWTPSGTGDRGLLASVSADGDASNLDVVTGSVATARLAHCDNNVAFRKVTVAASSGGGGGGGDSGEITVEADTDFPIPDDDPTGVTSELVFPAGGTVGRVSVAVDIVHTYIGDLRVKLISPSGTEVVLHNKTGRDTQDLIATFTSDTTPDLASLKGESAEGPWKLRVMDLLGDDKGTLRHWTLTIGLEDQSPVVSRSSQPRLAIPDVETTGISNTITVGRSGTLRSIAVPLDVRHTYIGDLRIALTAPSGGRVVLHDRTGVGAHDIVTTYTRDNLPGLATFEGVAIEGDWKLTIADHVGDDVGTLESWGLEIVVGSTAPTLVRKESAPGLPIPDDDPTGVSDTVGIESAGTITGARIQVEILHTYIGDLRVALTSPTGTEVVLHGRTEGRTLNLIRTYESEEFTDLQTLHGEGGAGTWKLDVADLEGQDTGTLVRWSVELTYGG